MFHELLKRIGEAPENVTHIAQSFYHDMRTAKDLGFGRRLWINRYSREGDPAYAAGCGASRLVGRSRSTEVKGGLGLDATARTTIPTKANGPSG